MGKFSNGFTECMTEVSRYLQAIDGMSSDVHARLMMHLSACQQREEMAMTRSLLHNCNFATDPLYRDSRWGVTAPLDRRSIVKQEFHVEFNNLMSQNSTSQNLSVNCERIQRCSLSPISDVSSAGNHPTNTGRTKLSSYQYSPSSASASDSQESALDSGGPDRSSRGWFFNDDSAIRSPVPRTPSLRNPDPRHSPAFQPVVFSNILPRTHPPSPNQQTDACGVEQVWRPW